MIRVLLETKVVMKPKQNKAFKENTSYDISCYSNPTVWFAFWTSLRKEQMHLFQFWNEFFLYLSIIIWCCFSVNFLVNKTNVFVVPNG